MYSIASYDPIDPDHLDDDWQEMHDNIGTLMEKDVIVVSAAGNHALERNQNGGLRTNVDTAPSVFKRTVTL